MLVFCSVEKHIIGRGGVEMVRIFRTIDGRIHQVQEAQEGCWIALTNPSASEVFEISTKYGI